MAFDRVVDSANLDARLTAIADAIRAKGDTTELLTMEGMVEAINAIEAGGGATDITDSVVSVAFSASNASAAYIGFDGIVSADTKITIFLWGGDTSNAANNQCLLAIFPRAYPVGLSMDGRMLYARRRNGLNDFQTISTEAYDLIVNAGDTFRMVVIK